MTLETCNDPHQQTYQTLKGAIYLLIASLDKSSLPIDCSILEIQSFKSRQTKTYSTCAKERLYPLDKDRSILYCSTSFEHVKN